MRATTGGNGWQWAAMLVLVAAACGKDDQLMISGTVEIREIHLAPLASGRVARLLKDEGDSVRAGDTIAVIEQPGLDALINERRERAAAVSQRTAEIQAAVADSARTANDLARARPLREREVISAQQFDQIRSSATSAAARLEAVRAGPLESRAAQAAVASMVAIRDQLTLIAPADGIVLTRFADRGEAVNSGTPVVSIGLVHDSWIRAFVGERYVSRVSHGDTVVIRVDGVSRDFHGHITEIAPRAEFTPRSALTERERADLVFGIKVAIDDDDTGRLKAGLPVTLHIPLAP